MTHPERHQEEAEQSEGPEQPRVGAVRIPHRGPVEAGAEPAKGRRTAKPNQGQRRPANPHLTEPDRKGGTWVHQAPCPSLPEPATPGGNQQSLQDEGNRCLTLAEPERSVRGREKITNSLRGS